MTNGTKENPWQLKTAPGTAEYTMYRDEEKGIIAVSYTHLDVYKRQFLR